MCKKRDLVIVDNYISEGNPISKHTFVVISDENGEIQGLPFDMVCNALSSFKDDEQKKRKLSYPGNFQITANDTAVKNGNRKDGYIKADQFYYFNKNKTNYRVIGQIDKDVFELLIEFINNGEFDIIDITDNL